jgi:hypothetical protein
MRARCQTSRERASRRPPCRRALGCKRGLVICGESGRTLLAEAVITASLAPDSSAQHKASTVLEIEVLREP